MSDRHTGWMEGKIRKAKEKKIEKQGKSMITAAEQAAL